MPFQFKPTSGEAMGFSGIAKGSGLTWTDGKKSKKKETPKNKKTKSSDTQRASTESRQMKNIYEGEIVEPRALPAGQGEIIDAEIVPNKPELGGSRKAIGAPTPKALEAPAAKPVNSGRQFFSVDKSGSARAMVNTPYGQAVNLER